MTKRILFVSTGGICRAPMAVGALRAMVRCAGLADSFEIDGAATCGSHAGQPPSLLAIEAAARRGYEIGDLRTRPLVTEDMAHFDYPLAMDRTHLAAMRLLAPSRLAERPHLFMQYAPARGVLDVQDPYGGTNEDFERTLDLIEAGCAGLLRRLQMVLIGARG